MDKPKFIIKNDLFILGWVKFHKELTSDRQGILGGGWWHLSTNENELTLYGFSTDFGAVTKEQIIDVFVNGVVPSQVLRYLDKVFYSPWVDKEKALKERELIMLVDGNHIKVQT